MTSNGEAVAGLAPLRAPHFGTVAHFDVVAGLGTVTEGERRFRFHCTAIVDGSRDIAEASAVSYVLAFGADGELEASDLVPAPPPSAFSEQSAPS